MTTPPPPKPRSLVEKTLAISAIGMGVGFGTCGLTALTRAGDGRFWSYLEVAGSIIFFVSFAVAALAFVVLAAQQLRDRYRNRKTDQ